MVLMTHFEFEILILKVFEVFLKFFFEVFMNFVTVWFNNSILPDNPLQLQICTELLFALFSIFGCIKFESSTSMCVSIKYAPEYVCMFWLVRER